MNNAEKKHLAILMGLILAIAWMLLTTEDVRAFEFGQSLNHNVQADPNYSLEWDTSCPWHKGSQVQQDFICYAWKISNGNRNFILTMKAENGNVDPLTRSLYINKAGHREPSYGFCQIHARFHPEKVNDPRFFTDPFWQLDQCWSLYSDYERRGIVGNRFYGYNNRWKVEKFFKF